ncbi:PAS domain S-box protein [Methanoculleus sp.]|jgi:PAS domain S-box-containing protein|uniref:PAS domain S-box protein n=1 Tax=Methanoculleus sp. TaxID=90427 RepID=UPI001BD41D08|nr:PAS domain S-box protein [Methanoculleus sp.]
MVLRDGPPVLSILYVDDEPLLLDLAKLFLEKMGNFSVDTVDSAVVALERVKAATYSAIISDYQMPEMDGIQFLKELRSSGDRTPFIIFTGKGREEVVIQAFASGADFYVQKGGEPKSQFLELSRKIRQAVNYRRAETALRRKEENYRLLVESANEGILIVQDDRIQFSNPRLSAITGIPHDDLIGTHFSDYLHPDDRTPVMNRCAKKLSGEDAPDPPEFRIVGSDGKIRWASLHATRILWRDRFALLVLLDDITERKQAEEENARQSRSFVIFNEIVATANSAADMTKLLESFLDATLRLLDCDAGGIYLADRDTNTAALIHAQNVPEPFFERIRTVPSDVPPFDALFARGEPYISDSLARVSPEDAEVFGFGSFASVPLIAGGSIIGALVVASVRRKTFPYPERAVLVAVGRELSIALNRVTAGGAVNTAAARAIEAQQTGRRVRVAAGDGTPVEFEMTLVPGIRDFCEVLIGIGRDAFQPDEGGEDFREIERRFHLALEGTGAGMWDWDLVNDRIVYSPQWKKMLGYEEYEKIENTYAGWRKLWHPDDSTRIQEAMDDYLAGRTAAYEIVYRLRHKDGSWRRIFSRGGLVKDSTGKPLRWVGVNVDITERTRTQEALNESIANFRAFFETISDMIMAITPEGRILFCNKATEDKLGYTLEELARMRVIDLHPADLRTEAEARFSAMLRGEQSACPLPVVTKSGAVIPVETRIWSGHWNGRDCIFGISKDMSAEFEAKQLFERLFRSNPAPMALSTVPEWRFSDVNDAFLKVLGYSRGDVIGKTPIEIGLYLHPEQAAAMEEGLRTGGRILDYLTQVQCKSGEILDGMLSGDLISSPGERFYLTVMINITEQKRAEKALKRSVEERSILLDNIQTQIWYLTDEHTYGAVNRAHAEFIGLHQREIALKDMYEIFPEDVVNVSRRGNAEAFSGAGPVRNEEWLVNTSGERRLLSILKSPKLRPDGTVEYVVCSAEDITERRRAEDGVLLANKKLNILNSVTRHDILNQTTVLAMLLQVVEEGSTDAETIEFVRKAAYATERLTRQVEFTREYQDIGVQSPRWQNVSDVIVRAKDQLAACPYRLRVDTGAVEIYADPLILKVFYNLLENAVRHGETVSTVRFLSKESEDGLKLICEDDGVGIDPASKKYLFRRGYGKHTGYGLYLVREILSITGITIQETGEPGGGARFEMTVPKGAYRTNADDDAGHGDRRGTAADSSMQRTDEALHPTSSAMRRRDKEIADSTLLFAVLEEAFVCRIGLVDGDVPYVVPMNFVYSAGCLYLHSAGEGRKIEILGRNNRVCFEAETGVALVRGERTCDFSARYISVIGTGAVSFVTDLAEKSRVLDLFMGKYAGPGAWSYPEAALRAVTAIRVDIETLTGKASGYTEEEVRRLLAGEPRDS